MSMALDTVHSANIKAELKDIFSICNSKIISRPTKQFYCEKIMSDSKNKSNAVKSGEYAGWRNTMKILEVKTTEAIPDCGVILSRTKGFNLILTSYSIYFSNYAS